MRVAEPQYGSVGRMEFSQNSLPKGWFGERELIDLVEDDFSFEDCRIPPGRCFSCRMPDPCILWRVVSTITSGTSLPMGLCQRSAPSTYTDFEVVERG